MKVAQETINSNQGTDLVSIRTSNQGTNGTKVGMTENPYTKTPAASEQIRITAPTGPMFGLKAENNNKLVNPPDQANNQNSNNGNNIANTLKLFKDKETNGNGPMSGIGNNGNGPMSGIGNNGKDKPNAPPGLLKKDDDDKDKGPVAIGKYKNKNKGPVSVGKEKDKDDKIHGKPDTAKEIKGALSKMWELIEELREKASKSKSDSADEEKSYGFGAGMVSLNTSQPFQTSSKPTYARPVGAAKGAAIHINGGSDSKSGQSGTTIVNNGGFSLGSLTNKAGALATYSQIQDIA